MITSIAMIGLGAIAVRKATEPYLKVGLLQRDGIAEHSDAAGAFLFPSKPGGPTGTGEGIEYIAEGRAKIPMGDQIGVIGFRLGRLHLGNLKLSVTCRGL
jgi:hypothetical protein